MKELEKYKEELDIFCKKYDIKKLSLFGSNLYLDCNQTNDIDIIIEFETDKTPGLLKYCQIENELSDLFNKKVDLQTEEDLSVYFRQEVLKSSKVFYERKG
jgi:predicted nucleotidyltransferase